MDTPDVVLLAVLAAAGFSVCVFLFTNRKPKLGQNPASVPFMDGKPQEDEDVNWGMPAVLLCAGIIVWLWPDRSIAVLLILAALATSPMFFSLSGRRLPGREAFANAQRAAWTFVTSLVVTFLVEILPPSLNSVLPPVLKTTLRSQELPDGIADMVGNLLSNRELKNHIKEAMETAVNDEELMSSIRAMVQTALRDETMYGAVMHGIAGAAHGGMHKAKVATKGAIHDSASNVKGAIHASAHSVHVTAHDVTHGFGHNVHGVAHVAKESIHGVAHSAKERVHALAHFHVHSPTPSIASSQMV